MHFLIRFLPFSAAVVPALALAQFGEIDSFFSDITGFINQTLVPLIFAIAFLVFLWGVFNFFILGGGDDEKRKEGRKFMLYGIGGFVIMVSVWGIVNLLSEGLGLSNTEELQNIPDAPTQNN